jgi:hypothetical protein
MFMHRLSFSSAWRHAALAVTVGLLLALATTGCASPKTRTTTLSAPPTQAAQLIDIVTDHSRYHPSQAIGVTVRNVTGTPLYAIEQYSACTMLQLQFRLNGKWDTVQPCIGGPQPQLRLLAPKVMFPLSFGPGNAPDNPNLWRVGTYRFALQYGTKADGSNIESFSYSAGFEVTA